MNPLVLVGFMACGKSRVGALLARRLGRGFVDLDDAVEARAGRTIAEVFATDGEPAFRRMESDVLDEVLCDRSDSVIAAGGGTFASSANRVRLAGAGARTVFLEVPFEVLAARLRGDSGRRPLATDGAALRRLYDARLPTYRSADLTVPVGADETPAAVVDRILLCLREIA